MVSHISYCPLCKPHHCNVCSLYQAFPLDRPCHRGRAISQCCRYRLPCPAHSPTRRFKADLSDVAPRARMETVFQSRSVYHTGSCTDRPFFRNTIFKRSHCTGSGCSDPVCRILLTRIYHKEHQINPKRKAERVSPSPPF